MPPDVPERGTLDLENPQRLLEQAFQVFFNPEIERRRVSGEIGTDFGIFAAQVIFNEDERWQVRFNEEVEGHLTGKATQAIEAGQEVLMSMIGDIESFELTTNDPNAAHMTVFYRGEEEGWLLISDFRFNATIVREHGLAAREFLETARSALEREALRPFVENLLAATELTAKGTLLSVPVEGTRHTKKHSFIKTNYNRHARVDTSEARYVKVFNRLHELRSQARYLRDRLELGKQEAEEMLAVASDMVRHLEARTPKRIDAAGSSGHVAGPA